MDQQKIIDEINYFRTQTITRLLFESGIITADECDKLLELEPRIFLSDVCGLITENT